MRNARYSLVGMSLLLAMAVAASCSKKDETSDDDNGDDRSGKGGEGAVIDLGEGGSDTGDAGGGNEDDGGNGSSSKGGTNNGEIRTPPPCDSIEGLDSECGSTALEAQYNNVNMLIVLDKSGSMEQTPGDFGMSKWEAVKAAFEQALPKVQDTVNFGLALYPFSWDETIPTQCEGTICCAVPSGDDAITVPVGKGSKGVRAVMEALENTSPGGGTPTSAALAAAYDYFTSGAGLGLKGSKYVLLATDGAPNCNFGASCDADRCTRNIDGNCPETQENCCETAPEICLDDPAVVAEIRNLQAKGISTFVVGIPGTELYESYLDDFANEGGVPASSGDHDYFKVSADEGVEGLVNVFTDITTKLVRDCKIALPNNPVDSALVNVAVNCTLIPKEGSDGSGWTITPNKNDSGAVLQLSGPACDMIEGEGAERVDVVTGCPTVIIE